MIVLFIFVVFYFDLNVLCMWFFNQLGSWALEMSILNGYFDPVVRAQPSFFTVVVVLL